MQGQEHHILFPKRLWMAQNPTRELRQNRWLKPRLDPETHNQLHRNVGIVAVYGYLMAERVNREFFPDFNNYVSSLDELCFAIQRAMNSPTMGELDRRVGALAIECIQEQRPYVKHGLILPHDSQDTVIDLGSNRHRTLPSIK